MSDRSLNSNNGDNLENFIGAVLVGASLTLTGNSSLKMAALRTSGSKMFLFPIVNFSTLLNEFAMMVMIFSSADSLSNNWGIWSGFVNNATYLITKPIVLYLAYLRCRAVYEPYRKYRHLHFFIIIVRVVELLVIVIINLHSNFVCGGEYTGICQKEYVIYQIRDGLAPVFRFYYILSEGIFYIKLFSTLKNIHSSEASDNTILRYRTYQTILFTLDLSILLAMSIYRMFYLTSNVPSYVYAELFSSALTVFVMTEFGLSIPEFFKSSTAVTTGSIIPTYNAHCSSGNSIPPRNQGSTAHCDLSKKPSIIGGINTDQKNDIVNDDNKLDNDHSRKNSISALRATARELIARERRNAKEKSRVSFQGN
ncbi:3407_t:CDS:2 [Ambispora leptoticha]|uniref:3407_t:CDS:1 n=1 Tax=Ambispora leptoticha TaxID=144679 RepID=A0A9N8ZSB8_9GLOM|nr:3407_t:CDS:2 [Ambispora leptoticha]